MAGEGISIMNAADLSEYSVSFGEKISLATRIWENNFGKNLRN